MKIGVISDLHIFNKTVNIKWELSKLRCVDMLLMVGDLADRGEKTQYDTHGNRQTWDIRDGKRNSHGKGVYRRILCR